MNLRTCLECFAAVIGSATSCPKCGGGSFSPMTLYASAEPPLLIQAPEGAPPVYEVVGRTESEAPPATVAEPEADDLAVIVNRDESDAPVDEAPSVALVEPPHAAPAPLLSNPQSEPQHLSRREQRRRNNGR